MDPTTSVVPFVLQPETGRLAAVMTRVMRDALLAGTSQQKRGGHLCYVPLIKAQLLLGGWKS